MTTIIDLNTKQSTITEDSDGFKVERYALVHGVTGDADQKLKNALADAGLPSIGDAHPEIASITLQSKRGTVIDASTVQVQLSYGFEQGGESGAGNASVDISGSTIIEERKADIDGNVLVAKFAIGATLFTRYFTADVETARQSLNFSWTDTTYPRALIDYLTGTVNSANWNGYAPKTLLCTSIAARETASGYDVTASFSYNPETWLFKARTQSNNENLPYLDYTGDADSVLDHSTGIKEFDVYPTADFTASGITIPGPYVELTGTVTTSTVLDSDIQSGGKTIILELTDDTWVTAGATFDAQRQNILDGLVSNKNETNGFNAQNFAVTDVARTSSTVVTITLSAEATYDIVQTEEISITVPASALTTSSIDLKCSGRFTIRDQSEFDGGA